MIFLVKKARSQNTEVEYIRVDLEKAKRHTFSGIEPDRVTVERTRKLFRYEVPVNRELMIVLTRETTKHREDFRGLNVKLIYTGWVDMKGREVKWPASLGVNTHWDWVMTTNALRLPAGRGSDSTVLYFVRDHGLWYCEENRSVRVMILKEHEFNYIYEKVGDA